MKKTTILIWTLLLSCLTTTATAQSIHKLIKPEAVHSQIAFLSCDAMKGRMPTTNEIHIAAEYIIQHFRSLGIKPFFSNNYRQEFAILDGRIRMSNVIGMIEGTNKDEYIVIGAHYDHIGTARRPINGDSICNGADDNASGTTAVLQLAKVFAEQGFKPERTIVFALWDGEEARFKGSQHFVNTFPNTSQIKAYVNFDMIGRFEDKNDSSNFEYLYPKAYPIIGKWMRKGIKRYKLDLPTNYQAEDNPYRPSDNMSFSKKNIPVICFHTDSTEDLHKPSDEIDKINVEKATDIIKAAHYVIRKLATEAIK